MEEATCRRARRIASAAKMAIILVQRLTCRGGGTVDAGASKALAFRGVRVRFPPPVFKPESNGGSLRGRCLRRVARLNAHPPLVVRRHGLTTGEAVRDFVPLIHPRLPSLPAEVDPPSVQRRREVQQSMLETSWGKTNASDQDLFSHPGLDPFHGLIPRSSVAQELRVIGVFGDQNLGSPERVQDLKLCVMALHQISEVGDLLQHGLHRGDEPVRLLYSKGLVGKRLIHAGVTQLPLRRAKG